METIREYCLWKAYIIKETIRETIMESLHNQGNYRLTNMESLHNHGNYRETIMESLHNQGNYTGNYYGKLT